MDITETKRELYNELKKTEKCITGAGIREDGGNPVIIIYINNNEPVSSQIPSSYKGITVITEVIEDPKIV